MLKFGLKQYAAVVLSLTSAAFAATAYINQIGYRVGDAKEFALVDGNGDVEIVDASGATVLKVTPSAASNWEPSGQNVQLVDFSELNVPGTYSIKVGGQELRKDLKIAANTYEDVTKASLKWYYYQRASMALEETYAGQWKRAAGHTNASVQLHNSTGESGSINSTKGWYDAGDYGRYIVNSGITTYTLLSLFEHFPDYFKTLKWNIPADGTLPDLLAEIKYNLDWMLTMQASDGGVYHKLTSLGFPGDVMPADDIDPIYVIGKGSAATFDFAAVMAVAARVYKPFDASYASKCLEAAKKAYAWGAQNPNKSYSNPNGVQTGEYGDRWLGDEKEFASTELFVSTGDASYKPNNASGNIPSWADVGGLATYGMATHATELGNTAQAAKDSLLKVADNFVNRAQTGFGVVMAKNDFVWGSNAVAGNQGVWLLHAYYLTGEAKYYQAAVKVLDYLLGKNPLDMSFLTGFGTKSAKKPHHRPSTSDKVKDPVPGMIVGGPQPGGEDIGSETWECKDYRTGFPATSYVDNNCSYASNEVAINWNAPFAYLAGAIEAINHGYAPSFAVDGVARSTDAIKPAVARKAHVKQGPQLRFVDQKLYVEKNGKRFNLKGHRVK
ncbi:endoglucanase [Fibrobacter sp. UWB15]|uniref:glycoside hydrolase family 9 protein n=1 Tax=unclassified Fibrobacter TaxID=2634177 RepID=UPI00090FF203|nr:MULTISPECIES: glycoside hydrolase family 9 protein [unclassified Fibrobacter]PWJ64103.1 endoglucanase [Fibrobacter sp. UWB6]SHG21019.1 endoglucanase [Fibrobacter sp. UWB8]SMG29165.1 endoglucanase [Fibrobacter sp. UWB15]